MAQLGIIVATTAAVACGNETYFEAPQAESVGGADTGHESDRLAAPVLLDDSALLEVGFGSLEFIARDGHPLHAEIYRATGFDPVRGPIWFVMHGAGRSADSYVAASAAVAERYGALAIGIRFSKDRYPTSDSYTLGVRTGGSLYSRTYDPALWRDTDDYVYSEVEHLFEASRETLGGVQKGYYLFGHSAGAQFTHRLLTFLPDARVLGAVAANAGWYTLPSRGSGFDAAHTMPYGLQGSPVEDGDLESLARAPLTVLLGSRDTAEPDQDPLLRSKPAAMAQGNTRLARGQHYFEAGRVLAEALGSPFGWRLAIVPGAGHHKSQMLPSAGFFLFDPGRPPCEPSVAAHARGVLITEIYADPEDGEAGDANGDGVRDALADEFVELVNTGSTPVCLAGWTLTDADEAERHRFPLGRALEPGGALVVFGGGIPTGSFGGADVQWAAFGGRLSLSNGGDVLSLRDAGGDIVHQVSWGDCDGQRCAGEYINGDLEVDGAVARWPEPNGNWTPHREVAPTAASPGTHADGTPW